jgi:alpha-2-macroglobulin
MGEDRGLIQRIAGSLNKSERHWQGSNDDFWTLLGFIPLLDAEGPAKGTATVAIDAASNALADFSLTPKQPQASKGLEFSAKPLSVLQRDQLLPVNVAKTGDTPVYYTMIMRYALPNETAYARDEGIEVEQRYETLDGDKVGEKDLKLGETYRVRVDVSTTKRRQRLELLVPIPNGLEIIDPTFVTSGKFKTQGGNQSETIQRETVYGDTIDVSSEGYATWNSDDWEWYWYKPDSFALDNMMVYRWRDFYAGNRTVTFLVRVTTPGIYPTPPASASLEFEPEVFGRSEGKLFVINP